MNKDLILREKLALQRTILANQTTLLAFLRTAMYFLVAGISVNNLTTVRHGKTIELIFISIALILLLTGFFNYFAHNRKIARNHKHVGNYNMDYLNHHYPKNRHV